MKKGFTLIELLVVIAIIGVLSSVVLASLNSARSKGNNVAVRSNLDTIRSQAQLYVDDHSGSFASVCTADTTVVSAIKAAKAAGSGTGVCNDSATAWAAQVQFKNTADGYACVDSLGISTTTTSALGTATACPSN